MTLALFFSLYCFEAGIFFLVVPWTRFWAHNPIVYSSDAVGALLTNFYVRGLFSGFGVLHFLVGAHELFAMFRRRRSGAAR
jgi:hypothetical protein